ncbi:MAG: intradiol ring-cleavage dioxygenase [Actinomycetota bacterium]
MRLSRREAIAAGGAFGVYLLTGCESSGGETAETTADGTTASCVLAPEQTEGPYYVTNSPVRSDITAGRAGFPLALRLTVVDADGCRPIENATLEVWHCDADGIYSGVNGDSETFCRGAQTSDADGKVVFNTVFPGWYTGRAVHIHVKAHVGGSEVHTGQLYFDEADLSRVYQQEPYASRGAPDTSNASDGIYSQGGAESTLAIDGDVAQLTMGVRPT